MEIDQQQQQVVETCLRWYTTVNLKPTMSNMKIFWYI